MSFAGLIVGFAITVAVLYGIYRVQRRLRGDDAPAGTGGLVNAGIRKSRGERQQELDQFIADFRAQQSPALTRQMIDSTPDHQLGIELKRPQATAALTPPARLAYLLLKSALPDHHVLPGARVADFLHDAPPALQTRGVDFLVCNRAFAPVCVVHLRAAASDGATAQDPLDPVLQDAGVRSALFDTLKPPRRDRVRALVLGEPL